MTPRIFHNFFEGAYKQHESERERDGRDAVSCARGGESLQDGNPQKIPTGTLQSSLTVKCSVFAHYDLSAHILAKRLNCSKRFFGMKLKSVYLLVLISLLQNLLGSIFTLSEQQCFPTSIAGGSIPAYT